MNSLNITVGCLALVSEYGSGSYWFEVIGIDGDVISCTNGTGEDFNVSREDISDVTDDDSVLKV